MSIIHNEETLEKYLKEAVDVTPDLPVYLDKFLENAIEIDVDAVCDGENVLQVIMEQIEEAGIHSGDSACVVPAQSLSQQVLTTLRDYTDKIAKTFKIIGLTNIQYAVKNNEVYVIEINPRASRTTPFASKAIGLPLAKIATRAMLGQKIPAIVEELHHTHEGKTNIDTDTICVKEVVLPFRKLGLDPILRPEMQSTGEVIGVGTTFGEAFYKAQIAAGITLRDTGPIFISVADYAKESFSRIITLLKQFDFTIYTTPGTGKLFEDAGLETTILKRISEGSPNILDLLADKKDLSLLVNIPKRDPEGQNDALIMRKEVVEKDIPFVSTLAGFQATLDALRYKRSLKIKKYYT